MLQKEIEDFYSRYRGRYSQHWAYNWGLIPNIPTSFDNANSIYELLSWLQRAFKNLLDDFVNLELEFEQYKNALTDLFENLIPEIIRNYVNSDEFAEIIRTMFDNYYNEIIKPKLTELERTTNQLQNKVITNEGNITLLQSELLNLKNGFDSNVNNVRTITQRLNDIDRKIQTLESKTTNIETTNKVVNNIFNHLKSIGVMNSNGDFIDGMGVAGGNINLFSGVADGGYYIRTANTPKENDLFGGV